MANAEIEENKPYKKMDLSDMFKSKARGVKLAFRLEIKMLYNLGPWLQLPAKADRGAGQWVPAIHLKALQWNVSLWTWGWGGVNR